MDHDDLSDELPSSRADVVPWMERTSIHVKGEAGRFKGEVKFSNHGTGRSVAGVAVGFLGFAAAASMCAGVVGAICALLAHAGSVLVLVATLIAFVLVLAPGLIVTLRKHPA